MSEETKKKFSELSEEEQKSLQKSNEARLKMFNKSKSGLRIKPFVLKEKHTCKSKEDACAVVGTISGIEYAKAYASMESGQKAMDELNLQYFS